MTPLLDLRAAEIIVKRFAQPNAAVVTQKTAPLYSQAEESSERRQLVEQGIVLSLLGRTNKKVNAWGKITYWFEVLGKDRSDWSVGYYFDFLRPYYFEDPLINFFLNNHLTAKPSEVRFYQEDLDGDGTPELILQWPNPVPGAEKQWGIAVCQLDNSGLASGGAVYRTLFETEQAGPFDVWLEDVDLDKRTDVWISHSGEKTYSLTLVKWVYGDNVIREAFSSEVSRINAAYQINLINYADGTVGVERVSLDAGDSLIRETFKSFPDGSFRKAE